MEATAKSFSSIMNDEQKLKIPFFQRKYTWDEKNWEELFNDLNDSYEQKKEHFLGSIILRRSSGNENFVNVIDGQQRLTTFSILVSAILNSIGEKRAAYDFLLVPRSKKDVLKIEHSKLDRDAYKKVILYPNELNEDTVKKNTEFFKIERCFLYFKKRIQEIKIDNFCEFLDFIIDSRLFVVVNLGGSEDEQKIFDSINSTGVPLNATDIIKNVLFDKIIKIAGEEVATNLYVKYWQENFQKDKKIEFWDTELSIGRLKRARSEIFLHAFALIENIFDAEKDSLADLSKLFKKYIEDNLNDEKNIIEFLDKLQKQAKVYMEFPQITKETTFSFDEREKRFFQISSYFDINVFVPLVMLLKEKNDNYEKCLKLLEILVLCNSETKSYNKFVSSSIGELKNSNDCYETLLNLIKDKEYKDLSKNNVEYRLKNLKDKNKYARCILFWIELHRYHKNTNRDTSNLNFIYTLEHLAPQEWKENWKNVFADDEEAKNLIYQIGNMTLLKGQLNASLSNNSWDKKLNGDGKSKNYIKNCATLEISKELLYLDEWNKKCIEDRTKHLLKEFFEIWNVEIFQNKA